MLFPGTFSSLTELVLQGDALAHPCAFPGFGSEEELRCWLQHHREEFWEGAEQSRPRPLPPLPSWMGHFPLLAPFGVFLLLFLMVPFGWWFFAPATHFGAAGESNPVICKLQHLNPAINLCSANTGSSRAQHPLKIHARGTGMAPFSAGGSLEKCWEKIKNFSWHFPHEAAGSNVYCPQNHTTPPPSNPFARGLALM